MSNDVMEKVKNESVNGILNIVKEKLEKIILFGSYTRGDFTDESDIDIAVLVKGNRQESEKYMDDLVKLSVDIDLKNYVVVNFLCLPYNEFNEKKSYYPIYKSIDKEGLVLYG